jgi:hypothetical protein
VNLVFNIELDDLDGFQAKSVKQLAGFLAQYG